ncbi:MAG: mandelate racemase/muconate lactonizing enzyme family protein [Candidatus Bathyarchaeia archaeon]|jgi:L-alanine-DL-glutamate epimerase-like enolase superfamily enzyme
MVNHESYNPSTLKITDLRTVIIASNFDYPIIRIDTNQGVYGLGEVRDAGNREYALQFKGMLLDQNPMNIEALFREMKGRTGQRKNGFSGQGGRESGGISAIEMALWDIIGKVYEVPVYQFLGGKYRDKIRIYADTPAPVDPTPQCFAERALQRKRAGLTFIKFDMGIDVLQEARITDSLTDNRPTEKGIAYMASCVAAVREAIGWEIPLAIDHLGPLSVKDCIRVGNTLEKFNLAWLEDMRPEYDVDGMIEITRAIRTPTLIGEGLFSLDGFREIIDKRAVDLIQPDLATAGGIRETKKIADYAEEKSSMSTVQHFAGSPISFMANIHVAAAIHNFVALEHHGLDIPWWKDLVTGLPDPLMVNGYVNVPEKPGLGVDLNEEVIVNHLKYPELGYFKPTPEWNKTATNSASGYKPLSWFVSDLPIK